MIQPLETLTRDAASQLDQQANAHLLRGLALLEENRIPSLRAAVRCFDEAIALRCQLPIAENCWFRYGLIAGWLNRADALTRLGSAEELSEALRSYDAAFAHLRELPMNESPLFVKRLAIAWLNRGCTLLKRAAPGDVAAAVESLGEAVTAAGNFSTGNATEGHALLAAAWMNQANALIRLSPPEAASARGVAVAALQCCGPMERSDAGTAWIAFSARHILCQALAHLLANRDGTADQRTEWFHTATDVVDDGLALARHWEARGDHQFQSQAVELFRFGCRVYQLHQPHFLTEFLLEHLESARPDGERAGQQQIFASAMDALWRSLGELQREGFRAINTPGFARILERLRELRITEDRVRAWHRTRLKPHAR